MLKRRLNAVILAMGVLATTASASPEGAAALVSKYKLEHDTWTMKLKAAKTLESMRVALAAKPDQDFARKLMIKEIGSSLKQGWTLKYCTWLLENTSLGKKDTDYVINFAKQYHMNNKDLGRFCYAVIYSNMSVYEKKKFIELAIKNIKDPKQKGMASLSLAVVLRGLGDTAVNSARRIGLIKYAVIHSAEMKLGNSTVGDAAMEEIYKIKNLSKGRPAPAISGLDTSGRKVSLGDYKGRVVMLVFWSSFDVSLEETRKMLDMLKAVEKKNIGKPFAILGVNRDWVVNLRELEKEGLVSGTTITDSDEKLYRQYRVNVAPTCFIIDQQGVIQFQGELGAFAYLTVDDLINPAKKKVVNPKAVPALK